jgi:putative transcriptional regulator
LLEQLEIDPGQTPDAPVYAGGPVEPGRGFVLHTPEYSTQGTILVAGLVSGGTAAPRWALTSTLDVLTDIAAGRGPQQWLMALGYTGWGPSQLDGEMTRHGWQNSPGSEDLIWQTPAVKRWAGAYAMIGINVALLSPTVGRA